MTRRWPYTLPGMSMPGFSLSPVDPSIRSDFELGAQRARRRTLSRLDQVATGWKMTDAEFLAFRSWYEGLPVSLIGASDDFSTWSLTNVTRSAGAALSPDGVAVDRLVENTATATHAMGHTLTTLPVSSSVLFRATLKMGTCRYARVGVTDWAGTACYTYVDLQTGTLLGQSGLTSRSIASRGDGWYRVEVILPSGAGVSAPVARIYTSDTGSTISHTGTSTYFDVCELQARVPTGYDLFVPSDDDGNGMGADGGAAWFWTDIAVGGGLTRAEARFSKMYAAPALPGLNRDVTAEFEVRNA